MYLENTQQKKLLSRTFLLVCMVFVLAGCGERVVRPFVENEFDIQRVIGSNWILFHCGYAAYQVKPKPLSHFQQQGSWKWQALPLPDEVEYGMGLTSRTYGAFFKCMEDNEKLQHEAYAADIGKGDGYYRFYQENVLAFYLPETNTLMVGYVEF